MKTPLNYRQFILREIEARRNKNPYYNVSSLASTLHIPASRLSEILRNKVGISTAKAENIATILKFSPQDKKIFLDLVASEHSRNPMEKSLAQQRIKNYISAFKTEHPSQEIYHWHVYAIALLLFLRKDLQPYEMARELGLGTESIVSTLERMLRLKILSQTPEGFFPQKFMTIVTDNLRTKESTNLNLQMMTKSMDELKKRSSEESDFSLMFMTFTKDNMVMAKQRIKNFQEQFIDEFGVAPANDSVYAMAIQFYELTGNNQKSS